MLQSIKNTKCYFLYLGAALFLICTISLLPVAKIHGEEHPSSSGTSKIGITPVLEEVRQKPPSLEKKSKKQPADSTNTSATAKPLDKPAYSPPEAPEDKQGKINTMLIIGAGVAATGAMALALSGGGGGGGGTVEPEPTPSVEPVGVDIAGDNWAGYLDLVNGGRENVTAVVDQNGSQVEITTTSTQRYGQVFRGKIDANGHLFVYDQTTGETWTTHKGPVFPTQIDIYDYVNNFTGLDRLLLKR